MVWLYVCMYIAASCFLTVMCSLLCMPAEPPSSLVILGPVESGMVCTIVPQYITTSVNVDCRLPSRQGLCCPGQILCTYIHSSMPVWLLYVLDALTAVISSPSHSSIAMRHLWILTLSGRLHCQIRPSGEAIPKLSIPDNPGPRI